MQCFGYLRHEEITNPIVNTPALRTELSVLNSGSSGKFHPRTRPISFTAKSGARCARRSPSHQNAYFTEALEKSDPIGYR
jgi:hypothetical protein